MALIYGESTLQRQLFVHASPSETHPIGRQVSTKTARTMAAEAGVELFGQTWMPMLANLQWNLKHYLAKHPACYRLSKALAEDQPWSSTFGEELAA